MSQHHVTVACHSSICRVSHCFGGAAPRKLLKSGALDRQNLQVIVSVTAMTGSTAPMKTISRPSKSIRVSRSCEESKQLFVGRKVGLSVLKLSHVHVMVIVIYLVFCCCCCCLFFFFLALLRLGKKKCEWFWLETSMNVQNKESMIANNYQHGS